MAHSRSLSVGLAVGQGTGTELANVFERVLKFLAQLYSLSVEVQRSSRLYHTYFSLDPENSDPITVRQRTAEDVEHYEQFCRELVSTGTRVMFKTAINAQSLYLVREHQQAIKVECFSQEGNSLLLVRDQAQGFYTGMNQHDLQNQSVSKTSAFSKDLSERIVLYSITHARQIWGKDGIDSVVMVYKFHLFDGVMSAWAKEWTQKLGVKIEFVQPDTANRNLLAYGLRGRQVMIAGNEWADIMHVILLDRFGQGAQETRCTKNVYLAPELKGLTEYQTVHGSADDIGGRGIVNPSATIRAVARILEEDGGGCEGLVDAMESTITTLEQRKASTGDQGGKLSTKEVVDLVLETFEEAHFTHNKANGPIDGSKDEPIVNGHSKPTSSSFSLGRKTAVLVLDFQNDFVTKEGIGAHYRGDMKRMEGPAANIPRVVERAREQDQPVVFVRFLGDERYEKLAWRARDAALGKKPKCLQDTWGSEFFPSIAPAYDEPVFHKQAAFDAFLADGFEEYLSKHGIEHLILMGVYTDVCVDSTARTGFQKGYLITVVSDCTTTLHLPFESYLAYMERLYGARIIKHDELIGFTADQKESRSRLTGEE